MADNFSLDDILAEVDRKRASRAGDASSAEKADSAKTVPSITDVLAQEEIHSHLKQERSAEAAKKPVPVVEKPDKLVFAAEEKEESKPLEKPRKKAEKAEKPVKEEKPAKDERLEKSAKAQRAEKLEKPEKTAEKAEKGERLEKPEKAVEKGKSGLFFGKSEKKKQDLGVTQILTEIPSKSDKKDNHAGSEGKKGDSGVTQIISEAPARTEKSAKKEQKPLSADMGATQIIGDAKPVKEKKAAEKKPASIEEIFFKAPKKKEEIAESTASDGEPEPQQIIDEREAALTTKSIEMSEAEIEKPQKLEKPLPSVPALEKKAAENAAKNAEKRQQLKQERFERELELDDPDDLIDAINPLEMGDRSASRFDDFMSGDTIGIAGNDLKKLAGSSDPETAKTEPIVLTGGTASASAASAPTQEHDFGEKAVQPEQPESDEVKAYTPQSKAEDNRKAEIRKRSNTAFLEKLNQSLAKQRAAEEKAHKTLGFEPEPPASGDPIDRIKAPEQGLNLDYSKQIIQATGAIPTADSQLIDKITSEKKKRSLRDFVMETEEDDEIEEEEEPDNSLEFDSYDTTGQIWADLCESHKGLKTRFLLLLVLTVLAFVVTLFNDFGQGISFDLFGMNVDFMSRRYNPQGYIFFNLVLAVIGMVSCSTLLVKGISKLFRGKADCDSVCAVTNVIALLMPVLHLTNFDYLQRGKAYIYTAAALAGLLFNTAGKLLMIVRAKQNFRFISGDSAKYSAILVDETVAASQFTKGLVREIPYLAAMRKTEFLTDFLRNSYCEDKADKISRLITPVGLAAAVVSAILAYFVPNGSEGMENNIFWATTVLVGVLAVLSPFAVMFVVNVPLSRACKALAKSDSVVMGYKAAEEFAETNSVMVDASLLFPAGSAYYTKLKHCKHKNSINNINVDQAIILAGSLAIQSGSVLSKAFHDTVADRDDLLVKVENCVYEDNMGVLGWYGNKRLIMGNREHMLHHDIRIPEIAQVNKQLGIGKQSSGEVLYLAVAGELVLIMLVELIPNNEIKNCLQKLVQKDVRIAVKTTDSIVTVAKVAELFEIDPEYIKILPASAHEHYAETTRYVSRGNGAVSCNGTFSSLAKALLAAKNLLGDIGIGMGIMLAGAGLGALCAVLLGVFAKTELLSPSVLTLWNMAWFLLGTGAQCLRKY